MIYESIVLLTGLWIHGIVYQTGLSQLTRLTHLKTDWINFGSIRKLIVISGQEDTPSICSNAAPIISSMIWCRQGVYSRSFCSIYSIRMRAPLCWPVFDAVVSKHKVTTHSLITHSFKHWTTATAWTSPVPDDNLGSPSNCSVPVPEMRTGSLSTCSFVVKSSINLPSQWTVRGTAAHK